MKNFKLKEGWMRKCAAKLNNVNNFVNNYKQEFRSISVRDLWLTVMIMAQLLFLALFSLTWSAQAATRYKPTWSSLDSRPLPSWYDEAKIGIFMHFGPYAVPGNVTIFSLFNFTFYSPM